MGAVWGTEQGFHRLFQDHEPKFFDLFPVKWFFDAGESGVMVVFVIFGMIDAVRQLRRQ
jgi:hypothetical protein